MAEFFQKYIKKQYLNSMHQIKYKTNFTNCIYESFQKIGFQKTQADDWDIIWSQKQFINEIYEKRLQPHQKINHFRNYFELCRKDLLVRNLKKHKKTLQREGKQSQSQTYNFYPQTYILPSEYVIFVDEFKKNQSLENKNIWIMKPTGKSQGKGIFLFNKLSQVSQWESHSAQNYIVQKYINDPLLIGGKKFDIRIYALVTSYSPLTVYLYRSGFARFTHSRYEETKINQSQIHLTNVAIQKNADGYDEIIGGKWYLDKLKTFLASKYGQQRINASFYKIQQIVIKTLEAHQKVMSTDRNNSFELYGFDVLFDSKLQPWLIEVNASPSMTANTQTDYKMKMGLLEDTMLVIDMQKMMTGNQEQIGGFDLICKGKSNKNSQILVQKLSFLGTFNNRMQNLKKLAKNNCNKINSELSVRVSLDQQRKPMSHNITQNQSINTSKRNIMPRKAQKQSNGRDFVIKQRAKRQPTNQNQPK